MKAKNEISEMFIGDDGLLSIFNENYECEVTFLHPILTLGEVK